MQLFHYASQTAYVAETVGAQEERQNSMELSFKKAGVEYLETLVELRIEFIKDIHPEYKSELTYDKE